MWKKLQTILAIRDLRNKLFFTICILMLIRVLDHITVPLTPAGRENLLNLFSPTASQHGTRQLFGLLDVISGGSLHTFSIIALSVYPYITATIVISLLQPIIPALQNLATQGEAGRQRISRITRIVAVPLSFLQAFSSCAIYQQKGVLAHFSLLDPSYMLDSFAILLSLTAGVMILIWFGDLITEKGIGNGVSLIIFGGIISTLPQTIQNGYLAATSNGGSAVISVAVFLIVSLLTIVGMVYMYMGQRRVSVQYPTRRMVKKNTFIDSAKTTYIPMQVNSTGMIPLIFASSMLLFPAILVDYLRTSNVFWLKNTAIWLATWIVNPATWWYWTLNALLVFAFTYFYAYVVWQQQNLVDSLQKQGAFIQGYRPGEPTSKYLMGILNRITLGGAIFLAIVTILPFFVRIGSSQLLSSTSLLILIGVVLDTIRQVEAEMEMRNYSGFLT